MANEQTSAENESLSSWRLGIGLENRSTLPGGEPDIIQAARDEGPLRATTVCNTHVVLRGVWRVAVRPGRLTVTGYTRENRSICRCPADRPPGVPQAVLVQSGVATGPGFEARATWII